MRKLIYLLVLVVVLNGCVTIGVNRAYKNVDYLDGVDKEEAIVIAKKNLLEGECKDKCQVNKFSVRQDDDFWEILFAVRKGLFKRISDFFETAALFPFSAFFEEVFDPCYFVKIRKDTGEVVFAISAETYPE
ncbi:MAG: hypothetical protein JW734_00615 [Candidatus Omnitrophica bacterium]|nr:hypothetical protein [Candidatus Omnitrophota bacterium]